LFFEQVQGKTFMSTIPKSPSLWDGKKLLAECDDEQSFANRCLHVFVREAQVDMNGISAALDRNDFSQIARLAHRIKGASASIRAEFLREQAEHLEVLGSQEELVAASECFARLKVEFEHFKKFIATLPNIPD
jgi:HPt (histidine-containing phosphotransfer) domain-containing protein